MNHPHKLLPEPSSKLDPSVGDDALGHSMQPVCCRNNFASFWAEGSPEHAMKWACLENRSTTVQITVLSPLSGSSTIQSMAVSSQGLARSLTCCHNLGLFLGSLLLAAQIAQFSMSFFILATRTGDWQDAKILRTQNDQLA